METLRKDGILQNLPVDTGVEVINGLATVARAGKIKTQGTGLAEGDLFVGIAAEGNDNTGETEVRVYRKGTFVLPVAGTLVAGDLGAVVYLKATGLTKTKGTGVNVKVGYIVEVIDADNAAVAIEAFAGLEKAITSA